MLHALFTRKCINILASTTYVAIVMAMRVSNGIFNASSPDMAELTKFYFLGYALCQLFTGIFVDNFNTSVIRLVSLSASLPCFLAIMLNQLSYENNYLALVAMFVAMGIFSTSAFLSAAKDAANLSANESEFVTILGISVGLGSMSMVVMPIYATYTGFSTSKYLILILSFIALYLICELYTLFAAPASKPATNEASMLSQFKQVMSDSFNLLVNPDVIKIALMSICYAMYTFGFCVTSLSVFAGEHAEMSKSASVMVYTVYFTGFAVAYAVPQYVKNLFFFFTNEKYGIILSSGIRIILSSLAITFGRIYPKLLYFLAAWAGITSVYDLSFFSQVKSIVPNKINGRAISIINMTHTIAGPLAALVFLSTNSIVREHTGVLIVVSYSSFLSILCVLMFWDSISNKMVKIIRVSDKVSVPMFATYQAACLDLSASESVIIPPKQSKKVLTGISVVMPKMMYCMITGRSSMFKFGVMLPSAPTIIDSDFYDEIKIELYNTGTEPCEIEAGQRIAQAIFKTKKDWIYAVDGEVTNLINPTTRKGGFGSTGK